MISATYDAKRHRLIIRASNAGRANLADAYRTRQYLGAESLVAECLHEVYEFVDAGHVPGAMTDAPILVPSEGLYWPDNGQTILGDSCRVFWFPGYMVECPWETLLNRGRVEFEEATPYEPDPNIPAVPRDFDSYLTGRPREGCAVWIGEQATVQAVPECAREDAPDMVDPGLYFWRDGRRHGPYGAGAIGCQDLEKDGGAWWQQPEPDPSQLAFDFQFSDTQSATLERD
jgi:hypothetical protein